MFELELAQRIEAFEKILKVVQGAPEGDRTEWNFFGEKVCVASWKKLHALGFLTMIYLLGLEALAMEKTPEVAH